MPLDPPPPIGSRNVTQNPVSDIVVAISLLFLSSAKPRLSLPKISFPLYPRRPLKTPNMSRPTSPTLRRRFPTPQSLHEYLSSRLPSHSLSSWGIKPGTKNVHNLWLEISQGETSLAEDITTPVRTLAVVTVKIKKKSNPDLTLMESHQQLSDGSLRYRNRPLSEKMKPGETPEEAAVRAVKEELGLDKTVIVLPGSVEWRVEEREESVSYPGLAARYKICAVEAEVEGLPEEGEEFVTEEEEDGAKEGEAVTVRRHFWKWVCSDFC